MAERQHRKLLKHKQNTIGYLFAFSWIVNLLVFVLFPIAFSAYLSFTRYDGVNPPKWLGLTNYKIMFTLDPSFWKAFGNTLYYMFGSVFLKVFISLILAVILNNARKGMGVFRTIFFLPVVLPVVPVMFLWMMLFNPNGLINRFLAFFGIPGPLWLNSPAWSKPALIMMSLWGVGGIIVIFLAALQDIPRNLYEAAQLDGANSVHIFFRITLPMLSPVILFCVVTGFISASQVFAEAYIMTGGGPLESTTFVNLKIYLLAFKQGDMGYASAMAWFMFLIMVPLTIVVFRVFRKWLTID
ncbi:MAG: ABC transporter permease [Thermotogae bacterium]|nr:MAG: ABC transporter permease [Thermotogota bacterium]